MTVPCQHLNFNTEAAIARLTSETKPLRFRVDFKVRCADCDEPFMFLGVPHIGYADEAPSLDVSRLELSIPIAPWDGHVSMQASYELPR